MNWILFQESGWGSCRGIPPWSSVKKTIGSDIQEKVTTTTTKRITTTMTTAAKGENVCLGLPQDWVHIIQDKPCSKNKVQLSWDYSVFIRFSSTKGCSYWATPLPSGKTCSVACPYQLENAFWNSKPLLMPESSCSILWWKSGHLPATLLYFIVLELG